MNIRSFLCTALLLVAASPAMAQIQSQKPVIPGANVEPTVPAAPHFPEGALQIKADGSYVDKVDGLHSGQDFRLNTRHTITGQGLSGAVGAWVMSKRSSGNQSADIGSVLNIVSQTDNELVVDVTGISAGQSVWEPGINEGGVYILLITNGGARTFKVYLPQAIYVCAEGEPNCSR